MRRYALPALAGAAALIGASGSVRAADMPEPVYKAPEVEVVAAGWYLRGDIGITNQRVGSLGAIEYTENSSFEVTEKDFDAAPFFGLGIGYQFNEWFRMDVTGEYRADSTFSGSDSYVFESELRENDYDGEKSEWTFLVNAYVDLGNWHGLMPFIGAGIGTSRNTISGLTDTFDGGVAYAPSHSQWEFAWALYAGVGYQVMPGVTLEVAYRYIDLGDAQSGDFYLDGVSEYDNPLYFNDLTSHDLRIGLRWAFGGAGYADTTPVVSKY